MNGHTPQLTNHHKQKQKDHTMKTMKYLTTLGLLAAAALTIAAVKPDARHCPNDDWRWQKVVIDVACDGRTYAAIGLDPQTGKEARGTTFIVNGKLFPGGTIPTGDGFDLDTTQGSLGKWVCRGTWNFSLQEVLDGAIPHVSTTQHFIFGEGNSLMTEGPEGGHEPVERVVLGGTGAHRGVIGEVKEEFLGFNSTGFENFRCTFKIRKPRH